MYRSISLADLTLINESRTHYSSFQQQYPVLFKKPPQIYILRFAPLNIYSS